MDRQTYLDRRMKLKKMIPGGDIVIIASNPVSTYSNDKTYRYRHNTDLYYFTGCKDHDVIAIIDHEGKFILFVRPKDDEYELWEGKMLGLKGAKEEYHADNVHPYNTFETWIENYQQQNKNTVYHNFGVNPTVDDIIHKVYTYQDKKKNATELTEQIRIIKTKKEIDIMKEGQKISIEAHRKAIQSTFPGMTENQLEMIYVSTFLNQGALLPNHVATIASGDNGLILHYRGGNDKLENNDLVLVDTGCEYRGYTTDIARTWPISGKFSGVQRKVYSEILDIQKQCIKMVKPDTDFWDIHRYAVDRLVDLLLDIGVLNGKKEEIIKNNSYNPYFPHGIGHWLGMDTHDCLSVEREDQTLKEGMVLTIEPGIYLHHHENVPEKYRGIAIRIEDNVVVTKQGCIVLSEDLPKEIEEIENLVGTKKKYCIKLMNSE